MNWRVSGETQTALFNGQELELRPPSTAAYLAFIDASERSQTSVDEFRAYAGLVVASAHADGKKFFDQDGDADELVRYALTDKKNAMELAALSDAAAKAAGLDYEAAAKN